MSLLVLARHGQCQKNIDRVHGGAGSPLTPTGRDEARRLAESLLSRSIRPVALFVVERTQCRETSAILAETVGKPPVFPLAFEPFYLGVLAGLSEDECATQFPILASKMARYRRGEIEIAEVDIPGASEPMAFYAAAHATLHYLVTELTRGHVVVVGTRSVLVALLNTAFGRSPASGGGYREIPWDNGAWCALSSALSIEEAEGVAI